MDLTGNEVRPPLSIALFRFAITGSALPRYTGAIGPRRGARNDPQLPNDWMARVYLLGLRGPLLQIIRASDFQPKSEADFPSIRCVNEIRAVSPKAAFPSQVPVRNIRLRSSTVFCVDAFLSNSPFSRNSLKCKRSLVPILGLRGEPLNENRVRWAVCPRRCGAAQPIRPCPRQRALRPE